MQKKEATDKVYEMQSTQKTTVAVVVTYKRHELLKMSLLALDAQELTQIIVVNNGGASDLLTCQLVNHLSENMKTDVSLINTERNLGGAGGFALGIEVALRVGFNYMWLMDDDCIPDAGALAALLSVAESGTKDSLGRPYGFFASRVFWIDHRLHSMNLPEFTSKWFHATHLSNNAFEIRRCSFVSRFSTLRGI